MNTEELLDLLNELNELDEHPKLEVKSGVGHSLYETICSFSNEPRLEGGIILVGVKQDEDALFEGYSVCGVENPDRVSQEIATACATTFNSPVRPRITPVSLPQGIVVVIEVDELNPSQKPLYFKHKQLPQGAWRRIGSTDQRCTDEDLAIFYQDRKVEAFDKKIISTATLQDIDPEAIEHYRKLRGRVNPNAEEIRYDDAELLQALNAIRQDEKNVWRPTLTGLLLFGKRLALRRELPSVRVDYIRVPGKEWVSDPEKRYEVSVDMRGPLLQLVDRAVAAVMDDLPRGFELPEGQVQANTPSIPSRAIREAVVNALMHQSYRLHRPTQIIRYANRIEIINPGFSLKNNEQLGTPGSDLRNPTLAAVFHETNTAETKGTGIRVMRELMKAHGFTPPTLESDRSNEKFTARFLLHHFLSESDLKWLAQFNVSELSEPQRYALILVRESGAVDNLSLRQVTGAEVLETSNELRKLCKEKYLEKKGGGPATYYVPGESFPQEPEESETLGEVDHVLLDPDHGTLAQKHVLLDPDHGTLTQKHGTLDSDHRTLAAKHGTLEELSQSLPEKLQKMVTDLGKRPGDRIRKVILELCRWRTLKAVEVAYLLGNREFQALRRDHLRPMVEAGQLELTYPTMEKHPEQAYRASTSKS